MQDVGWWYTVTMNTACKECASRLPVSEGRGPAAEYCGTPCRMRAYRRRKRSQEIPPEMRRQKRWIRRDDQKRPFTVHGWYASVTKPNTWTTFERASNSEVGTGLGFVLGDGIGCIDLDHCIDARGRVEPWAQHYIDRWRDRAIMVERSMSGRGVHIFLHMEETKGRMIRLPGRSIEVYSWRRYIAVTGDRI